jgi:saccharopine dehydrogenase-like NADP-dependent oxidoreductase
MADKVAVLGAGAMGSITIRDLVETAPDLQIVVGDYNLDAAKRVAKAYGKRIIPVRVDATKPASVASAFKGCGAIITAVQHQFNLPVMQGALKLGAHYCDLGGLFHFTRKQLKLHAAFRKKKLTAVLGCGAAPGVANVLAASAADTMDRVDEVHIMVGGIDRTVGRPEGGPLGTSYSLQTIMEEASTPAALFTGGKFKFVEAMSGNDEVQFPAPVGTKRPARTIHSEVATLPLTYKKKGIKECSFRIAFSEDLDANLRLLRSIGLLGTEPVPVGKVKVIPQQLLLALQARAPKPPPFTGVPDEYEIVRALVRGSRDGQEVEETVDLHTPGIPEWGLGVDVDTGCPPSIVAQMLLSGVISQRGVLAPEVAIPAEPFFAELAKRRMRVERNVRVLSPASAQNVA